VGPSFLKRITYLSISLDQGFQQRGEKKL